MHTPEADAPPGRTRAAVAALAVTATTLSATTLSAQDAWRYQTVTPKSGPAIQCAVLEPGQLEPGKPAPVLLGLPPGGQNRRMVEICMRSYWGTRLRDHGWVIVCPIAPNGERFDADDGATNLANVCRWIRTTYTVEGNGIHLAGVSNGGRGAFRAATSMPWQFESLLAMPGFPPSEADRIRLPLLKNLPVRMFVGGNDEDWRTRAVTTRDALLALGGDATLRVFEGETHVPASLDDTVVLENLEALRSRRDPARAESPIEDVLDAFHDAAAKADRERYFGLFENQASVFLGTDATERWTVPEFREWSKSAFADDRDAAWIFVPTERHVRLAEDASGEGSSVAWFDERLGNASFGECRGSGVVVRRADGAWRIAQYNLTIPIPNDLAYDFVARIRAHEQRSLETAGDEDPAEPPPTKGDSEGRD